MAPLHRHSPSTKCNASRLAPHVHTNRVLIPRWRPRTVGIGHSRSAISTSTPFVSITTRGRPRERGAGHPLPLQRDRPADFGDCSHGQAGTVVDGASVRVLPCACSDSCNHRSEILLPLRSKGKGAKRFGGSKGVAGFTGVVLFHAGDFAAKIPLLKGSTPESPVTPLTSNC